MQLRRILIPMLMIASFIIASCVKESNDLLDQNEQFNRVDPSASATIQFIHAYTPTTINGLSTSSTGFRILMNDDKINGASNSSSSTNTLRYGDIFGPGTSYAAVPAGSQNFKFVMNRIVSGNFAPAAGDEVFNINANLKAGKIYSLFIADPYPAPGGLLTEDNYFHPSVNSFGIRFINLSGDAGSRYDLVSKTRGIKLFSDVGFREMRDYIYPLLPAVSDTLVLRLAGTSTEVSTYNTFTPAPQRVYTFIARGKTGVSGRTPTITYYTN